MPWKILYLKIALFWEVTPCSLLARYERVGGIHVPSTLEITSVESEVLIRRYKIKELNPFKTGFKFFSIRCSPISEKAFLSEGSQN